MCERQQAPDTDHRTAFVVHNQLVDGTLKSVYLFLHFCYDALDFLHSRLGCGGAEIYTKTEKHYCEWSDLWGEILLFNLKERNDTVGHTTHQLALYALKNFRVELGAQFYRICLDFHPIRHVFKVDQVECLTCLIILQPCGLKEITDLRIAGVGNNDLASTSSHSFRLECVDKRLANSESLSPVKDSAYVEDATLTVANTNL